MDISRAKDILDYWFPNNGGADYDKWFMKSKDYDAEIKEKFGDEVAVLVNGVTKLCLLYTSPSPRDS